MCYNFLISLKIKNSFHIDYFLKKYLNAPLYKRYFNKLNIFLIFIMQDNLILLFHKHQQLNKIFLEKL